MTRVGSAAAVAVMSLAAVACGGEGASDADVAELVTLHEAEDYFELRARLDTLPGLAGPVVTLMRAAAANAFNDLERSNGYLRDLDAGAEALGDSLRVEAAVLRLTNHFRLHEYDAALEAGRSLLALPAVDSAVRADVTNTMRALAALEGVAPQRVVARGESRIEARPDGRIPVRVEDAVREYVLDTGANLSTMMRSEADSLGLRVRETGVEVGTSTGAAVTADVAVAPRLQVGKVVLENVVFLVVPDELLTFGPSFRIPGIVGFPVLDALGEVQFRAGGHLRIPAPVPDRGIHNLAMNDLTPMIRVEVLGSDAICGFDTGANETSLHLPFLERHQNRIEGEARMDTVRFAGAGGERLMPAWILTDVRVAFGDTAAVLDSVSVYTESVATSEDGPPADCRLGLDALAGFDGYLLNVRSMSLLPL